MNIKLRSIKNTMNNDATIPVRPNELLTTIPLLTPANIKTLYASLHKAQIRVTSYSTTARYKASPLRKLNP